ncbi:multiple sugar transport system permease protein [Anaerotaenia torta]|uniref:carbohydrate ABC transporter permease n=1 Tax=Anaerotaenia torta TaxID=433293 RepID=UPI003D223CA7
MAKLQGSRINPKRFSLSQLKFYIILVPLGVFMILPVIFVINQAFKPLGELYAFPPTILVKNPTLRNFRDLFALSGTTGVPMTRYLYNSVIVTVLTIVINLIITVSAAYAFSKKKFRVKNLLFNLNQMALMFVATAVSVPRYLVIVNSGMIDTWLAHILPLIAMPVGLFLVKQFVDQIPDALIEAAIMDGAKDFKIIQKVIIPLTKPALATTVVLTFQAVWQATEASNNFISNDTMRTLAFYLNSLSTNSTVAATGMVAAASVILFLPNLVIFIIMQSKVMNTMTHSGIK